MRKVFLFMFILTVIILLTGCATPYQRDTGFGSTGGYRDAHIRDNIYYVQVRVNVDAGMLKAVEYLNRRGRELCIENGYQDYRLYDVKDSSGYSINIATGPYVGSGGVGVQPNLSGYVECLNPKK